MNSGWLGKRRFRFDDAHRYAGNSVVPAPSTIARDSDPAQMSDELAEAIEAAIAEFQQGFNSKSEAETATV